MTLWDASSLLLGGLLGVAMPLVSIVVVRWLRRVLAQRLGASAAGVRIARNRLR